MDETPLHAPRSSDLRLFVDVPLAQGGLLEPSAAQCHFLLTVMRRQAGDRAVLFNGRDGEWLAAIEPIERRRCRLAIAERLRPQQAEPGPALLFAPLKRVRQEFLIEKATELGVARLEPVFTRRSVVDRINRARILTIAIEAAEQSGRLTVPEIDLPTSLDQRLESWPGDRLLYFGDETGAGAPVLETLRNRGPGDLLIGPEGGFTEEELAELRGHAQAVAISLGPRVLRAETAALAALACWQAVDTPLN
ncbi:MAG TPA: 16S rRNA (uracil(1498)-N(3))-methyltransferase [Geminicoccaceae bacterium]|nr:16S rRNA (uracil(1498)-N(3))-methyltransferase [Geminicoccaceae bacterium]